MYSKGQRSFYDHLNHCKLVLLFVQLRFVVSFRRQRYHNITVHHQRFHRRLVKKKKKIDNLLCSRFGFKMTQNIRCWCSRISSHLFVFNQIKRVKFRISAFCRLKPNRIKSNKSESYKGSNQKNNRKRFREVGRAVFDVDLLNEKNRDVFEFKTVGKSKHVTSFAQAISCV